MKNEYKTDKKKINDIILNLYIQSGIDLYLKENDISELKVDLFESFSGLESDLKNLYELSNLSIGFVEEKHLIKIKNFLIFLRIAHNLYKVILNYEIEKNDEFLDKEDVIEIYKNEMNFESEDDMREGIGLLRSSFRIDLQFFENYITIWLELKSRVMKYLNIHVLNIIFEMSNIFMYLFCKYEKEIVPIVLINIENANEIFSELFDSVFEDGSIDFISGLTVVLERCKKYILGLINELLESDCCKNSGEKDKKYIKECIQNVNSELIKHKTFVMNYVDEEN